MSADFLAPVQAMDAAFSGRACHLVDASGRARPIPVHRWTGAHGAADHRLLLAHCRGRTIDIGCGPGRLVEGLAARDVPALGIDISPEAVRLTRDRGGLALLRDVFAPVPGEGRWDVALLADGNIGIDGDPVRLLRRTYELVRAGGRVVVELDPAGTGLRHHRIHLRVGRRMTPAFDWARVGLDAIGRVAEVSGFSVETTVSLGGRHAAVLLHEGA